MPRHVFYSFHFDNDAWRTHQVRHMGFIEGNRTANPNEWEQIKRSGDAAIKAWIEKEMTGTSCVVVLIGSQTSSRRWVLHEIRRGWDLKKGVLGVHVHNLKDQHGQQSLKGANPFLSAFTSGGEQIPVYEPSDWDSKAVYGSIQANIAGWIDQAVAFRQRWS